MELRIVHIAATLLSAIILAACASTPKNSDVVNPVNDYNFEVIKIILNNCDWVHYDLQAKNTERHKVILNINVTKDGKLRGWYFANEATDIPFRDMIEKAIFATDQVPPIPASFLELGHLIRAEFIIDGKSLELVRF